ncbi:MAG: ATP-grasp domain-containing protein, partial [Pseudomonadota bacterium]
MDFVEHVAKAELARHGIAVPAGRIVATADEAAHAAAEIGPCVVKAQVPTGKRGKAGGIKLAATPDEARDDAAAILNLTIDDWS